MKILSILLVLVLLALWQIYSLYFRSEAGAFMPAPLEIYNALKELFSQGVLIPSIIDSLKRFFIGFFIGSFLGIVFGLILGRFKAFEVLLQPLIQFFRPISPVAWFPLIMLFIGIGDISAIFVITYACFFPVLLLCIQGVRAIPKDLFLMAKNFDASEGKVFLHIILPGAFLHIASGLKLAASIAWIHLVAGEMLGVQSGLGYLIMDGRNLLRTDIVLAAVVLIGTLGFFIHIFFLSLEKLIHRKLGKR